VADTPNMYLNRMESEGRTSELHKRPETFQDAFRTVGSGLMTYRGADREFTPGSTVKEDPYVQDTWKGGPQEDIPLDVNMDPEAYKQYTAQVDSIRAQYDYPEYPSMTDPEYAQQGKRNLNYHYMKKQVEYEAQQEFWREKHPDEDMPGDVFYEGNRDLPVLDMSDTDWYDYLDWQDEKEVSMEDAEMVYDHIEGGGSETHNINRFDVGRNWLGTEVAKRQVEQGTQPPTEEDIRIRDDDMARRRAYDTEMDRIQGIHQELEGTVGAEATAAGITMPPIVEKNHLLDTDKVIDFPTLDDMINDPKGVVSIYVDGSNRMAERAAAFNELYMSGNQAAENALRVAFKNLDSQDVINAIDDPAQWKRAMQLETLRIYSESDEPDFTGWDQLLGDY
jgi:hypothetical protein